MLQYDPVAKHLLDLFSEEFAALAFEGTAVEVLEKLDTEQPTVEVHRDDMTFKVRLPDEGEAILHIELQTGDSTDKPMPLRMLGYASFLVVRHEMSVYSMVLYLRPTAGRNDPGHYSYGKPDLGLQFNYRVIRLRELDGQSVLDSGCVGLLPFTPLMSVPAGVSAEAWVETCVGAVESASVDKQTRATLLFGMSVLGSLAHAPELFENSISEAIMEESPFYQVHFGKVMQRGVEQGIEQGIERGARETAIENILTVLTARFSQDDAHTVQPMLETITDLHRLKQLHLSAVLAANFQTFLQTLEA